MASIETNALNINGRSYSIHQIIENGISRFGEYCEGLGKDAFDTLDAHLWYIAEHGPPKNTQKFEHEGDGIYSIKIVRYKIRIMCFFDGDKILILTHGFNKDYQKGHRLKREHDKALKLRTKYFQQKGAAK